MSGTSHRQSIDKNKSMVTREQITLSDKTLFRSTVEKILLFLVVFFFIVALVFIALFVVYYMKYEDKESSISNLEKNISDLESNISSRKGSISSPESVSSSDISICNSRDCVESASMMIKKMNPKADPCQDFYEYACGQFMSNTVVPEGRQEVGVDTLLTDRNQQILKSIIEAEAKPDDPKYLNNMKNLYKSCMDEDQIEAVGLAPYLNDTEWVNDWPTLNSAWDPASFNLIDLIVRYERVYIEPLYTIVIFTDLKNTTKKVLYIGDGSLEFHQELFARNFFLSLYEKYITTIAVALGANRSVAEKDSREIVALEKAIAELGIARAVRAAFGTANLTLPDDEIVVNAFPTYLGNLSAVLSRFEDRVVQNRFGFAYARSRVNGLTLEMRKINLDMNKAFSNDWKLEEGPRWERCLDQASSVFSKGMSKQYVTRAFSEDAKSYSEFRTMLEENSWMSESTKNEAYVKLTKMKRKIGYPDHNFSDQDIESKYLNYTMTSDHYYNNHVLLRRLNKLQYLASLRTPVDRDVWHLMPSEASAYFHLSDNEIVFSAAILQPPYFSQAFQDAMNYGNIGYVIGHEISHGFYDRGSQHDGDGVLRNWWQKEDRERFLARTKCMVDQFSNFHVDRVNMSLRGIKVQAESVADLGGVKASFRAYKQLVKEKGEQPTLPGLGLTPDQVFFLAFGQSCCEKFTPEALVRLILTTKYPPGKYRVIGTLQNTKEFTQAFKCNVGSYMNPRTKCTVW